MKIIMEMEQPNPGEMGKKWKSEPNPGEWKWGSHSGE